jgi:hypothetical protein
MENVKADIFFVKTDSIPNLCAYEVEITTMSEEKKREEMNKILNALPYYLRRRGGHWARDGNFIISDVEMKDEELKNIIQELRENEKFQFLKGIRRVQDWKPKASSYAVFVARGLSKDEEVEKEIKQKLEELEGNDFRKPYKKEKIEVRRNCKIIHLVIDEKPAIGILIDSEIVSRITLKDFLREEGISVEDFINKEPYKEWKVKDKETSLVGRVISVIGTMKEKRNELVKKATILSRQERYERIPDDEEVVVVETEDKKRYDYPISELLISINSGNIKDVDEKTKKNIFKDLKIEPSKRMEIVDKVAQPLKDRGWIEGERISDKEYPHIFVKPDKDKMYFPPVLIGGGKIVERKGDIYRQIRHNGIYEMVKNKKDLKIAFSVFGETKGYDDLNKFIKTSEKEIKYLGFKLDRVYENFQKPRDIGEEIEKIKETGADILVAFIEDDEYELDDYPESNIYNEIKRYSLKDPILQTQVITFKTLRKIITEKEKNMEYILGNVVLGILAKSGNKPFIFAEPILGVDAIVGLDVTRRKKKKGQGTINYAAGVRIYQSNGELLKYKLTTSQLEGETIPGNILDNLLGDIKGKKVVVHRDGRFPQDEIEVLKELGRKRGAEFYLVEVIKSGAPRIYAEKKGIWVKINENEAYLLTTSRTQGTPVPIIVRLPKIYEDFSIEDAVISITSMTLLHWGSIKPPRLPVTTHYADKIGQFLLEGIISNLEGNIPFWL